MKHFSFMVLFLVFVSGLISGCSNSKYSTGPVNKNGQPIIGDNFSDSNVQFPGGVPLFVSMIQLKEPALLETAKKGKNGVYKIDEALKEKVLLEQGQMIAELQKISPKVRVLNRYRLVLNALAVEAPQEFAEQINLLSGAEHIAADGVFTAPRISKIESLENRLFGEQTSSLKTRNSMTYIGVAEVHKKLKALNKQGELVSVRGQGVKVGVVDSGVDFTHSMFGGAGTTAAFKAVDPNKETESFPNAKVVGGYDFAGPTFSTRSHLYVDKVPKPDSNPIDVTGHGTHVAGTVAGRGDNESTYDGAAPEADLYALKVFGDGENSSTSDSVVLAALEFAVDPNKDFKLDDRLDVLNLSLGGPYGEAHGFYNKAVTNITKGAGIVVVVSAGNSGAKPSIVGAPGSSDDTISVAAGIDYMEHNFNFDAIEFKTSGGARFVEEYVFSPIAKPREKIKSLKGKLVPVGIAEKLTAEQKTAVKGNIALIDRGKISFEDKIKNVTAAGALGAVVVNNVDGPALVMGGSDKYIEKPFSIPATMIIKKRGDFFKDEIETKGDVVVDFKVEEKIVKPELIGTMAGFSSQGPRGEDALIKPEITGPGLAIMSADAGTGSKGVRLQGTSMSAPHIAGVAALLVQYRPKLNAKDIKSLIMSSATMMVDVKKKKYSISRQGAGMVNAYRAATMDLIFSKPSLSLGKISVKDKTRVFKTMTVKNPTDRTVSYSFNMLEDASIKVNLSTDSVILTPGEKKRLNFDIEIEPASDSIAEVDAFMQVRKDGDLVGALPIMAVVNREASTRLENLIVLGARRGVLKGKSVTADFSNKGRHDGQVFMFNLLGKDERKEIPLKSSLQGTSCDLESVGYRIVEREKAGLILQIAFKTYNPIGVWETCAVSSEIDLNKDGVVDKELVGKEPKLYRGSLENAPFARQPLSTILINSEVQRKIDEDYQKKLAKAPKEAPDLDYTTALEAFFPIKTYSNSTLVVTEVPVKAFGASTEIRIRPFISDLYGSNVDSDDALGVEDGEWRTISLKKEGAGFYDLPEEVVVPKNSSKTVRVLKGANRSEQLVVYYPRNEFTLRQRGRDKQSQIKSLKFEPEINMP